MEECVSRENDHIASPDDDRSHETRVASDSASSTGERAQGVAKSDVGASGDAPSVEKQLSSPCESSVAVDSPSLNAGQTGWDGPVSDLTSDIGTHSPSEDATLFDRVSYLGVANINAPRSKVEILRNMMVLNQEKSADGEAVDVSIKIPHLCTGTVV